jgi:hypothetical protein
VPQESKTDESFKTVPEEPQDGGMAFQAKIDDITLAAVLDTDTTGDPCSISEA